MRSKWNNNFEAFLVYVSPDVSETSPHLHRKARITVSILLFIALIVSILWGVSSLLTPFNEFPFALEISFTLFILYIFKKTGKFYLSGNLLALLSALTLAPITLTTGGLYSDNHLWLIMVPLVAFLLADMKSGVMWSFLLFCFSTYLYSIALEENATYVGHISQYDPTYFYIAFSTLFLSVLITVMIFENGQTFIINELMKQKKEVNDKRLKLIETEKELRIKNKELEQFAYTVSHDLKQPARNIASFATLLEKQLNKNYNLSTMELESLSFINKGARQMQTLIDELLNFSRLNNNEAEAFQPVNLNDLLEIIKNNLYQQIRENKAKIIFENLPEDIPAVKFKLMQLFQNLISNGIKFRTEERDPIITVSAKKVAENWQIKIEDNGIGIKENHFHQIFELFNRLHTQEEYTGTGIGLATCKKIVEQHHGQLWVESIYGKGSCFYFTLPVGSKHAQQKNTIKIPQPVSITA